MKYWCSLAAPTAMTLGILGTVQKDNDFNLMQGTIMLGVDVLLYFLIFFFIDTVTNQIFLIADRLMKINNAVLWHGQRNDL